MKLAGSKEEPAPAPTEPAIDDAPPADAGLEPEPSSDDKPFDDEPFDAGVEADEQSDPKKFIEQLTGKLGQSLRKYNEERGQPDFELEKFAINSLLSATHTSEMDAKDQDDIIKKVKEAGENDDTEDSQDTEVDANNDTADSIDIGADGDASGSEPSMDGGSGEVNEEMTNLFVNPKKNDMFQPGSNDRLKESCWKGYKQIGMKEKNGKQVPNCVPVNEGESNNYMFWQNLKTIHHATGELLEMDQAKVDAMIANGHAWAVDHIATSSDDIEEVYHFMEANLKGDLNMSEKSSIFGKIKSKLRESFNQEEKDMSEPMVEPQVKPAPTTQPAPDKVQPQIAPSRKNKPFLPMPEVKPDPKAIKEGKFNYEVYHKTLSSALEEVKKYAIARGFDPIEFDMMDVQHVAYGQTERFHKELTKDGRPLRRSMNVQIYRMDSGNYELNMYVA